MPPDKSHPLAGSSNPSKKSGISATEVWQRYRKVAKERGKHLHSREHLLADDLSRALLEPKRFAAYLGIAKLYHESDLRALAKYILQKADLPPDARGKYFFAAVKNLHKRPGAKLKRIKKIRSKNGKNRTHNPRTGKSTS